MLHQEFPRVLQKWLDDDYFTNVPDDDNDEESQGNSGSSNSEPDTCQAYYENAKMRDKKVLRAMCLGLKPHQPDFCNTDLDDGYRNARQKQQFAPTRNHLIEEHK